MQARTATPEDAPAIARIYNQGIEDRVATFETRLRSEAAERAGFWKLVSSVFPENTASRALVRSLGFREVGTYEKHARLDGVWRDVIIVERLIPASLG